MQRCIGAILHKGIRPRATGGLSAEAYPRAAETWRAEGCDDDVVRHFLWARKGEQFGVRLRAGQPLGGTVGEVV